MSTMGQEHAIDSAGDDFVETVVLLHPFYRPYPPKSCFCKLDFLSGTVAEYAPSFPASLRCPDHWKKLWVKTPHWGTHPYCILMELRDFFFFFWSTPPIYVQSDNFSISCLLPAFQSWPFRRKIHVKSVLYAAWALAKRSSERWRTAICLALWLLGKVWVRLMKLDLTMTASLSLHVPPFLSALLSVYLS